MREGPYKYEICPFKYFISQIPSRARKFPLYSGKTRDCIPMKIRLPEIVRPHQVPAHSLGKTLRASGKPLCALRFCNVACWAD